MKLPSDFASEVAKALGLPMKVVEDIFEFEEDKQGYFYAKLKPQKFLETPQFRIMCGLVLDLGGEAYIEGMKVWKVPGPFAIKIEYAKTKKEPLGSPQKALETPLGSKMEMPKKEPSGVTPNIVSEDKSKPDLGPIPIKPGYYAKFAVCNILSPIHKFRSNVEEGIEEFIEQIATTKAGHEIAIILEPLVCRPAPASPGYIEVGCGERRLLAARGMGLGVVPVIVKEFADEEFDRIRLMENVARKDMPDYDLAKALKHLMDKYPKTYPTQAGLAGIFGKRQEWVAHHLDILKLDNIMPRGIMESGEFTERQAREILSAPEDTRAKIIDKITKTGEVPSAREIHEIAHPEEKPKPALCAHCGEPVDHPVHLEGKFYHEDCAEQVKAEKEPGLVPEATAGPFEKEPVEETETPKPEPQKIDTGFQWVCPECERKLQLIHVKLPNGKIIHQFEGDD